MKYVNLVQRGVMSQTHPVSGKSGKFYGTAVLSAPHGGVMLRLSLEDYMKDAHDLIGNTAGAQQWVPEFGEDVTPLAGQSLCSIPAGCRLGLDGRAATATHIWGQYLFCEEHAPANAARLDGQPSLTSVPPPAPTMAADVPPVLKEQKAQIELPPEHLPPPAVANEDVDKKPAPAAPAPAPTVASAPVAPAPSASIPPSGGSVAPEPQPEKSKAVDVIAAAVASALAQALPNALAASEARILEKLAPAFTDRPNKSPRKKAQAPERPPTEFQLLQREAKALNINTYGMGASAIRDAIAEKKAA